jgi:Protein of unknown function, DUF255
VDAVYMRFIQAMNVGGGWPMSVWLTPGERALYHDAILCTTGFISCACTCQTQALMSCGERLYDSQQGQLSLAHF